MKKLTLTILMAITTTLSYAQNCNPNILRTAPDTRYKLLNNSSEVQDIQTGLIWKRCSLGQIWSGTTCTGSPITYNWKNALLYAKNLGSDWRLPNIKELDSLVEQACDMSINDTFFPNTATNGVYSSSSVSSSNNVYIVGFSRGGGVGESGQSNTLCCFNIRLVRSGE